MKNNPDDTQVIVEVAQNVAQGHWYLVQKTMKGSVLHRNILAYTYDSKEEAEEAAAHYRKPHD